MAATEGTKELGTKQVVLALQQQLAGTQEAARTAEAAIAVYKAAAATIDRLSQVQRDALALAAEDMRQRELGSLETPVGRARRDEKTGALTIE